MEKIEYYCDHCKTKIEGECCYHIEVLGKVFQFVDLCKKCADELEKLIEEFLNR